MAKRIRRRCSAYRHLKPTLGDVPLKQLTPTYLQRLYASLLKHGRVERPESEHQPKGLSVKTLSGLLGHYSAAFTLDTYGHISTQMQQDAAQKVGGFLRSNV